MPPITRSEIVSALLPVTMISLQASLFQRLCIHVVSLELNPSKRQTMPETAVANPTKSNSLT